MKTKESATRMPRTCTLCRHSRRQEIDEALVTGESYRHIASRFDTSTAALQRHREHLGKAIAKAEARREETLIDQIERYRSRLETSLAGAESGEDWRAVAALVREIRGFLELVARLTGQLRPDTQVNVGVAVSLDPGLQAKIVRALAPFPEARQAVVAVLEEPVK